MAAIQLSFSLRTSPNCKTVHLIGNWDGYKGQLPLSKDSSKTGSWKGTFRFQGATLKQGSRYWYYYIVDGHHVSHDPAKAHTVEPTTGRKLNILDVPTGSKSSHATSRSSRRDSKNIPQGRALSPSRIQCPRPQKPNAAPRLELHATQYSGHATIDALTRKFAVTQLSSSSFSDDSESDSDDSSDIDDSASDVPSLSHSAGSRSPASSVSGYSSSGSSCCTCDRFGITRRGDRVRLDCGGSRCASDAASSSCDSESEEEVLTKRSMATRRHGVVVRAPRR